VGSAASCSGSGKNPPDAHGRSTLGFSEVSISRVDEMLFSLYLPHIWKTSPTIQGTSLALFRFVRVLNILSELANTDASSRETVTTAIGEMGL
jgi:hypothetical protein